MIKNNNSYMGGVDTLDRDMAIYRPTIYSRAEGVLASVQQNAEYGSSIHRIVTCFPVAGTFTWSELTALKYEHVLCERQFDRKRPVKSHAV